MPKLQAIELLPDAAGEAGCRADWQALRDTGLRSMLDHRGATNTPHVTVVAAPVIDDTHEARALELLSPLLPVTARVVGVVVLGTGPLVLARVVEPSDELVAAVLALRETVGDRRFGGWLPHLTVTMWLRREDLARAVDAVDLSPREITFDRLRRWDPDAGIVRDLGSAT